jgi:CcmD family protein
VSKKRLAALFCFCVALPVAALVWADDPRGYQPYVATSATDPISAPLFVVLAYSAIWLVLLLFVLSVWRRQQRVEAEMEQLKKKLGGTP